VGRFTPLIGTLLLVVAACSTSGSPTPTDAGATFAPASATPARSTPSSAEGMIPATVTFDGKSCTYAGPAVVPTGSVIEWTFTNTAAATEGPTEETILVVMQTRYGTTWEEVLESVTGHKWTEATPPYYRPGGYLQGYGKDDAAAGTPFRTLMDPYPYLVACYTLSGHFYPAILLQVMKG
jgi:hypothetical protein